MSHCVCIQCVVFSHALCSSALCVCVGGAYTVCGSLSSVGAATSIIFVSFVTTKVCLLRQNVCRGKHTFVMAKDVFCRDKTFVATKMILEAAPASDSILPSPLCTEACMRPLCGFLRLIV